MTGTKSASSESAPDAELPEESELASEGVLDSESEIQPYPDF